jgi:rod shape-determining protein MreC
MAKGGRASGPASGGPVAPEADYVSRRGRRVGAGSRAAGSVFPRRRPSVMTRRGAFAALLFASIALITVSYRGGAVLHGAQLGALEVVSPIERGLSRAWDPIAGAWDWCGRLIHATNENPTLKRENAELRQELLIAQTNTAEMEGQLRLLHYEERMDFPAGYDRVHAGVSVRAPGAIERSFVIDRGSDDGIAKDDAVMVTGGLIGRVTSVTPSTAVVGLIIDDSQNVSAAVVGSEAWGVLQTVSTEGSPVLQLRFVKQSAKVEQGDVVVTSGFSSGGLSAVYPGELPIGVVSYVGYDPADTQATIQVTPLADFDRIDEVFVLVPKERSGQ